MVKEREAKLQALRETLKASVNAGGAHGDEDLERALDETEEELAREGF